MISFQFLTNPSISSHAQAEIELLYVVEGSMRLRIGAQEFELLRDDYCVINSGEVFEQLSGQHLLLGEFRIQPDKLSEVLGVANPQLRCNSAVTTTPEKYEAPREVMKEIFSRFHNNHERDMLRMYSLYYRLLHLLSANFLHFDRAAETAEPVRTDSRTAEIAEFIRRNYDKPIRLNDLADQLHLSVAYLSKYIKKNLGMSFLDYLCSIRLSHAITALMHTNASVAHIAMDTGFANLSAFNKAFREQYHMTPSAYRQQHRLTDPGPGAVLSTAPGRLPTAPAEPQEPPLLSTEHNEIYLSVPLGQQKPEPLDHSWSRMINIGAASDLLRGDVQRQVLTMRDQLHFRYIRFWDLFSPEMLLDAPDETGLYTFSRLDQVLDFLLGSALKPYIELEDKPRHVIFRTHSPRPYQQTFATDAAYFGFLRQLIRHLASRYGAQELSSWFFEYWRMEDSDDPTDEELDAYLDRFDQVASILRQTVPQIRIGGGGFSLRYGEDAMRYLLRTWPLHPQQPHFLSLYCYPFTDRGEKTAILENQLVNPNSIKKTLELVRALLRESDLHCSEVHVTEWNISIINRSVLNDSYFKGAYVVKNLIDTIGLADLYGYWVASDLFSEGTDAPAPIFGGSGLITRNSIPKPAWYALEFLNELGSEVLGRGDNYIVTRDDQGAWRILCHNFKHFNYQYYLFEDAQLGIHQLDSLLADTSALNLVLELPAEAGARFRLKRRRVGRGCGSVQDAWLDMGSPRQPGREELADLARASVPAITVGTAAEENGSVHLQCQLRHNEIELLLLTPQE